MKEENITKQIKLILDKTNLYESNVIVKMLINLIYAEKAKTRLSERKKFAEASRSIKAYFHQLQSSRELHPQEYQEPDEWNLIESIKEKFEEEIESLI